MKPKRKVLKNGLRVIAVPMKDNPTVTVMVLVAVGSHYENKENNGISHFLEHMCFKGTSNRPSSTAIAQELDSLGSSSNAFTWYEYTGYHAKSRAKNFKKILDVVADMYLHATVPAEELEKERGVILEEINMYEDIPMRSVGRLFDEVLYGDQPAGRDVLGSKTNIRRITRDEFVHYRSTHYVADKTTVIVAGNIHPTNVFKEAEKKFVAISTDKSIKKPRVRVVQRIPQVGVQYKKSDQAHFILGFKAFPVGDKRSATLEMLATVLGKGMSSRLFEKLRDELGVCYYVRASATQHSDCGDFQIATGVDIKRTHEVIGEILKELRRIRDEKVDEKELQKAKEFIIGNTLMGLESSDAQADFYGVQEVLRQKLKTPQDMIKEFKEVTPLKLQRVAQEIFQNKSMNLAIIGPYKDEKSFRKILKL